VSALYTAKTFVVNRGSFIRFLFVAKNEYPMFEKLKNKWKVSGLQLFLILCTFAIGGSLTGFVAKKIMNLLAVQTDWLWAILYILLLTIIWPMMVLLVSILFGQFRFFNNYTRKLGRKLGVLKPEKVKSQN
jgi:hypothetical protein